MAELFQPSSAQIRDIIGLPETLIKLGPIHSIIETASVLDFGPTGDIYLSLDQPNAKILARKDLDILGNVLQFTERVTPANPPANQAKMYAKDVGGITKPFWLDSAGTETDILTADTHDLLSATHPDTTPATVLRGALVTGQLVSPKWQLLSLGSSATFLRSDGTDALWTAIVKIDLPATTVYTDQANTFGAFAQRFPTTQLQLDNPAGTFQYIFATSAIVADRTVTLPLLIGNDTLVFESHIQTLAGKTLTTPTIASFVNATHDHSNAAGGGLITAASVSDFDTQVRTSRLDQMATPTASVSMGNNNLLMGTGILQFVDANQSIQNNAGNLFYDVATGQVHLWRINNVTEMQLSATALDIQGNAVLQVGFLTSFAADPSTVGVIRLGNTELVAWRNFGNTADITLGVSASDELELNGAPLVLEDNGLKLENPAGTFEVGFQTSAEIANRVLTIPLLGANRTIVVTGLTSQIVIGTEVTGASTALTDTADIAYLNTANTYSVGVKQTVDTDATNAGFRDLGHTADPSSAQSGDKYYNTTSNEYKWYNGTVWKVFAEAGGAGEANTISSLGGGTVLTAAVPKSGVDLRTVSIATTAPIAHSVTTDLMTFTLNALVNTDIAGGAAIVTSKLADSTNFVLINQANIFGDFDQTFKDNRLRLENPAGTFEVQLQTSAEVADRVLTIPLLGGNRTIIVTGLANQIGDTEIAAHTSTKITITAKGQLNSAIVFNDQANIFGDFDQTFKDNRLRIENPAGTFEYQITAGAIVADRILNLPVTLATDTLMTLGLAQTVSGALTLSSVLTMSGAKIDLGGNDLDNIQNLIHDISTSGTDIDFTEDQLQTISISANTTFTGVNYATGKSKTIFITTDATLRTLTFPAGWKFQGAKPADQAASKVGTLTLTCTSGVEAGVRCAYAVEE